VDTQGHNLPLSGEECRALVRGRRVGRLGWTGSAGPTVQPVVYAVVEGLIVFRTAPGTALSELAEGRPACLQVDDLDEQTATGWSVLARGTTAPGPPELAAELPTPWAPGERRLVIALTPDEYTGRAVSAG
jgi:nitroimidazol reductase NimA-like FMN-containing flavoprotein (pyridoxamine 5'-phosphate oxidase superfamily)